MNSDLPPPSHEECMWMEHWTTIEDECPFPGASGRSPRKANSLREANDALTRVTEEAQALLSRTEVSVVEVMAYLARLRQAANDTQRLLPEVAAR